MRQHNLPFHLESASRYSCKNSENMAPSFINSTMFARPCRQSCVRLTAGTDHVARPGSLPHKLYKVLLFKKLRKKYNPKIAPVFPSFSTKSNTAKPPPFSSITERSITVWLKFPHIVQKLWAPFLTKISEIWLITTIKVIFWVRNGQN